MNAWTVEEFEKRLRAVGEQRYHHRHPFNLRMHAGELTKEEFQGWVRNRFYYQVNLPAKDAFILTKLPTREDRRQWIRRITDHDGTETTEGGIDRWLRLGESVGLDRATMLDTSAVLPGVRFAVDAYVNFCRTRPWLEAVASAMTELFAPDLLSRRVADVERHYPWIAPWGLEYFRSRLVEQPKDIEHLLSLVLTRAETREQQENCIEALRFKCDVLWSLLDAVQFAYSEGAAMNDVSLTATPRLVRKAMLKHDAVRNTDLLLLPERVVRLNRSSAAILRLCDGSRTVTEMVARLQDDFATTGLADDIMRFLRDARSRGWVKTA
jgi:pyrroloquinoline-quinone synthase